VKLECFADKCTMAEYDTLYGFCMTMKLLVIIIRSGIAIPYLDDNLEEHIWCFDDIEGCTFMTSDNLAANFWLECNSRHGYKTLPVITPDRHVWCSLLLKIFKVVCNGLVMLCSLTTQDFLEVVIISTISTIGGLCVMVSVVVMYCK